VDHQVRQPGRGCHRPGSVPGPGRGARGWAAWTTGGRVAATPAGAAAHSDLLAGVSAHRRRVADGITAEEYRATVAVLHRMAANLGWVDPGDSPGR
jgi:hypothetical protein